MKLLLQEYLSSGDVGEACRCVQELDVPHFHHELVYEVGMSPFMVDLGLVPCGDAV